ncbi:hypothetical protein BC832DRAFT_550348, partial [Gaertneriomyces semiglobifer]
MQMLYIVGACKDERYLSLCLNSSERWQRGTREEASSRRFCTSRSMTLITAMALAAGINFNKCNSGEKDKHCNKQS